MHIPCYGIFALIVRLKHLLLSRSFPDGYQSCRWGIRSGITLPWVGHVSRALVKHMQGQRQAGWTISYLKISNSFFLLWVSCCKGHCSLLHQVAMWKKLVYEWLILVGYNSSDVFFLSTPEANCTEYDFDYKSLKILTTTQLCYPLLDLVKT